MTDEDKARARPYGSKLETAEYWEWGYGRAMTDEDKARAAQRLLEEPMLAEALALVERDAIEAMLKTYDDIALREGRDTVKTVRAVATKLHAAVLKVQEAKRTRLGIV